MREQRQGPLMAIVTDQAGDLDVEMLEAKALELAAAHERELALSLPAGSPIRGLFLRNAAAYELATRPASRRGLRLAN
jgi:hypothetical protein